MGNREMRRAYIEARDKDVRESINRRRKLWRAMYQDASYIELEKPVFWGYRRLFELRKDIARRKDAQAWEALLKVVQNEELSKRKDFKRQRPPSRIWRPYAHRTKVLTPKEFQKKVNSRMKGLFRAEINRWGCTSYRFQPEWMFVSRIKKVYITSIMIPNSELQSERDRLRNHIDRNQYQWRYTKIKSRIYSWKKYCHHNKRRRKRRDFADQIEIREALIGHYEATVSNHKPMEDHHGQS
ncbi:MAG: hypothetical protein AAF570_04225 [Bacteroidota bacterium]